MYISCKVIGVDDQDMVDWGLQKVQEKAGCLVQECCFSQKSLFQSAQIP
jgi:hypothetical protein